MFAEARKWWEIKWTNSFLAAALIWAALMQTEPIPKVLLMKHSYCTNLVQFETWRAALFLRFPATLTTALIRATIEIGHTGLLSPWTKNIKIPSAGWHRLGSVSVSILGLSLPRRRLFSFEYFSFFCKFLDLEHFPLVPLCRNRQISFLQHSLSSSHDFFFWTQCLHVPIFLFFLFLDCFPFCFFKIWQKPSFPSRFRHCLSMEHSPNPLLWMKMEVWLGWSVVMV